MEALFFCVTLHIHTGEIFAIHKVSLAQPPYAVAKASPRPHDERLLLYAATLSSFTDYACICIVYDYLRRNIDLKAKRRIVLLVRLSLSVSSALGALLVLLTGMMVGDGPLCLQVRRPTAASGPGLTYVAGFLAPAHIPIRMP